MVQWFYIRASAYWSQVTILHQSKLITIFKCEYLHQILKSDALLWIEEISHIYPTYQLRWLEV